MKDTIVVIPARGGSKGIPRKNVRLLHGAPLMAYAFHAACTALGRDRVFITTEDEEIARTARRLGAHVIDRPEDLGDDHVTLDPVVHHATDTVTLMGVLFDSVVTIQPTSPLLQSRTIKRAVTMLREGWDTVLAVTDDRHLRWSRTEAGDPRPLYEARVNRQQLPAEYREAGALLATRREWVSETSRFGPRIGLLELSASEALDIDEEADWALAESYLSRRRIAIRVDGGGALGLGHVYRQLTLADRLHGHDVRFFMDEAQSEGISLAERSGVRIVRTGPEVCPQRLIDFNPEIVFVDRLDTSSSDVKALKDRGMFVVSFEDLGPGSDEADMVFNALYDDPRKDGRRIYSGPEIVCLREEFHLVPPKRTRARATNILITFGGTDPNDLTRKAVEAAAGADSSLRLTVVLGLGYHGHAALRQMIVDLGIEERVEVIRDASGMSELMADADIAITSGGRTVFEVLSCCTPCIVLAQNDRETMHTSADEDHGVLYLGLGRDVTDNDLRAAVRSLLGQESRASLQSRASMLELMDGAETILFSVLREYESRLRRKRRAYLTTWAT